MIDWIKGNLPTIFVAAVVATLIILAVVKLARDGKKVKLHALGTVAAVLWLNFFVRSWLSK